jgi:hypothetical protein
MEKAKRKLKYKTAENMTETESAREIDMRRKNPDKRRIEQEMLSRKGQSTSMNEKEQKRR